MTGDEIEQLFFQHLPESYVKRALKAVFAARQVGWEDTRKRFSGPEAKNVEPYNTRAVLEGMLRDAAEPFENVKAAAVKAAQNGWYHTEVRSGPVVLTENAVSSPCGPVYKAEFRKSLARSNQGVLFEDEEPTPDGLYVLLLHTRSRWATPEEYAKYGYLAGSAYLAFPASDLDGYIHEINLFARYPEIVAEHIPEEWDRAAQVRYLSRARKALWA